jgi:thiol-disulfide isomerase/thioredoxin
MKKFWFGFLAGIGFSFIILMVLGYFLGKMAGLDEESLSVPALKNSKSEALTNFNLRLRDLKADTIFDEKRFYKKIVFLNFWEYWCQPCKKELPSIQKLYNHTKDTNIVFAIISTEKPEITRMSKEVLESELPFYTLNIIPDVFKGEVVPRTYIIGKKGNIIVKEIGAVRWDNEKAVALIDSLKKEL